MSMLVDVFVDEQDARSLSLEYADMVDVEARSSGQFRVSIDDRVVNRWVFGRGGEAANSALERLLDAVGGLPGARIVIDRGVGSGVVVRQIESGRNRLSGLVRDVFVGEAGYDCGVVEFMVVGEGAV